MPDGRRNNGGARPGAGRPRKADEEKIKTIMDSIASQQEAFELLWNRAQTQQDALALWMHYRNGKPQQRVDVTTDKKPLPQPVTITAETLKTLLSDADLDERDI